MYRKASYASYDALRMGFSTIFTKYRAKGDAPCAFAPPHALLHTHVSCLSLISLISVASHFPSWIFTTSHFVPYAFVASHFLPTYTHLPCFTLFFLPPAHSLPHTLLPTLWFLTVLPLRSCPASHLSPYSFSASPFSPHTFAPPHTSVPTRLPRLILFSMQIWASLYEKEPRGVWGGLLEAAWVCVRSRSCCHCRAKMLSRSVAPLPTHAFSLSLAFALSLSRWWAMLWRQHESRGDARRDHVKPQRRLDQANAECCRVLQLRQ